MTVSLSVSSHSKCILSPATGKLSLCKRYVLGLGCSYRHHERREMREWNQIQKRARATERESESKTTVV